MASKDWVCEACSAQNRASDSTCRVCDAKAAARSIANVSAKVSSVPDPIVTPARMRTLLRVMNVLWYAALTLTGLQWLLNTTLPALLQEPAAILSRLRQFSPDAYAQALQTIDAEWGAWFAAHPALPGFRQVWQYGVTVLSTVNVNPIAVQSGVLTLLWALRLTAASLAEAQLHVPSRRNLMAFTILPADFLLAALALIPSVAAPWLSLRVFLLTLLTPQLAAITVVMALLLLIGACSRRAMTRCLLKCAAAACLIWLCAALLPIA